MAKAYFAIACLVCACGGAVASSAPAPDGGAAPPALSPVPPASSSPPFPTSVHDAGDEAEASSDAGIIDADAADAGELADPCAETSYTQNACLHQAFVPASSALAVCQDAAVISGCTLLPPVWCCPRPGDQ